MKNSALLIIVMFISVFSYSQVGEKVALNNQNEQLLSPSFPYKIYPTQNMWTFIKLDTRNGKMWQVQFDIEGNNRFETYLNLLPLVNKEEEVNNRFILVPTENIFTFILFDQIDGKSWQAQWSQEPSNRIVVPID